MFISDFKYLLRIYYILSERAKASVYGVKPKMQSSSKAFLWHSASASVFHQSHLLSPLASTSSSLPPVMPADQSSRGRQFLQTGIFGFFNRKVNKDHQVIPNKPRTPTPLSWDQYEWVWNSQEVRIFCIFLGQSHCTK